MVLELWFIFNCGFLCVLGFVIYCWEFCFFVFKLGEYCCILIEKLCCFEFGMISLLKDVFLFFLVLCLFWEWFNLILWVDWIFFDVGLFIWSICGLVVVDYCLNLGFCFFLEKEIFCLLIVMFWWWWLILGVIWWLCCKDLFIIIVDWIFCVWRNFILFFESFFIEFGSFEFLVFLYLLDCDIYIFVFCFVFFWRGML